MLRPSKPDAGILPRELRELDGLGLTKEGNLRADMTAPLSNTALVSAYAIYVKRNLQGLEATKCRLGNVESRSSRVET